MQKTFEAGKTAKELGIDITRKFIVVESNGNFNEGEIITLNRDHDSYAPYFDGKNVKSQCLSWHRLYYAEEPKPTKEIPLWTCTYKGNTYTETTINGEEIEDIDARLVELKAEQKEINSRKRTHFNFFKNK